MTSRLLAEVSWATVERRVPEMVRHYQEQLPALGYSEQDASNMAEKLRAQLVARQYHKADSPRPIHHILVSKRVTQYHLRCAIEFRPAARARKERLRAQYARECAAERERSPYVVFFSFESAYAKHLKTDFGPYRALFRLTPKSAETVFA